jgi:hypothetical protein
MLAMFCNLKNRYWSDGLRLSRPLRERLVRPLALFLTVLFLLSPPMFACAEMHMHQWSGQPSDTSFSSPEGHGDLNAERVENREVNSRREGAERFSTPKLEVRHTSHDIVVCSCTKVYTQSSSSIYALLYGNSLCDAPFSPRPPPVSSIQC